LTDTYFVYILRGDNSNKPLLNFCLS